MSPDRDQPPVRPEMHELLGAFALDAVEPHERAEIEQYLDTDLVARREVDELRETAALLSLAHVGEEPVPAGVWARIESELGDAPAAAAPVDTLHEARERRESRRAGRLRPTPRLVGLAAAVALVVGLAAGLALRGSGSGSSDLQAAYARASRDGVNLTVHDAGARHATMARIAIESSTGAGYLQKQDMPALPAGEVYQLWVVPAGSSTPISAGVLGADPGSIAPFHWSGPMQRMAISVEKAPGASTPSRVVGATA